MELHARFPATRPDLATATRPPSRIARLFVALLVVGTASTAWAVEELEASYPLLTDLADATATYGDVELLGFGGNVPDPPDQGVCSPGAYFNEGSETGQDIRTPQITGLTTTDFQLDVDYKLTTIPDTEFDEGGPIVMGGFLWRWIGIFVTDLTNGGKLAVKHSNSELVVSDVAADAGIWHSASLRYEEGEVELEIDGEVIVAATIGDLDTGDDLDFSVNDASLGLALNGCIRNLRLVNDTTLRTLFRDGFDTEAGYNAWSGVVGGT